MKTKIIFLMAAMLLMSVCSFAQNGNTPLKGDVNGDGKVDVADIVAILKIMKDAGGQGESKENTVTFIDRGTVLKTITGPEGTPVTAPEVSAWSGHNFVGWNENESAGIGRQVITEIGTSDVTYYAQWEEVQEQTTYYWYVGTTKPTSLSEACIVESYPTEQTFTNPSTTEKNYVYVLTTLDKTVNFYDPSFPSQATTKNEDLTSISGYIITSTSVKLAKGGEVIIKISDEAPTAYYWYVGQTDPSTMTSISPIVTDNSSPGWRCIGNTLTDTYNYDTSANPITGTSKAVWYFALPNNSGLGIFDAQNTNYATGTPTSTVTINGILYNIWNTGATRSFNAYYVKNK